MATASTSSARATAPTAPRAARLGIFCSYDATRVYGSTHGNGCHRSDVATIKSAGISVSEKINLACSGARSVHIWRASQGGQSFKGEAPQADQLLTVAQQKNVKLVVLTILANDVSFSDHVINCTVSWILGLGPCNQAQQAALQAELPAAQDGLRKSIDEVRAVMAAAGYSPSQWKFVVAGYASPVPAAADVRYSGSDRWWTGRLPVLRRRLQLGEERRNAAHRRRHAVRCRRKGRAVPRRARLVERPRDVPQELLARRIGRTEPGNA